MLIETLVFGRQNGLFHDIRDLGHRHDGPAFLPEFAQQVALGGQDPQGNFRLVVREGIERRQGRVEQGEDEGPQQAADDGQPERYRADVEQPAL